MQIIRNLCNFCVIYLSLDLVYFVRGEMIEFEPVQMSLMPSVSPISSTVAVSALECGSLCHSNPDCNSFAFDCGLVHFTLTSGTCNLYSAYVTSTAYLTSSDLCYIQCKIPGVTMTIVTPDPTTTTTTTTAAATITTTTNWSVTTTIPVLAGEIRGLVEGDFRLCSAGSGRDFILITDGGVYVYDTVSALMTGSCSGPTPVSTMFSGYPSMPAASDVECVLIYQSEVEIYAGGSVYVWQFTGVGFDWRYSRTYQSHLDSDAKTALTSGKIVWCTGRTRNNVERHFYMDNGDHIVYDSQLRTVIHTKTSIIRHNGFNVNPWSDIPDNVLVSTGYTTVFNENFLLITSNLTVYSYALTHSPDGNNPTKTVTAQGTLTL